MKRVVVALGVLGVLSGCAGRERWEAQCREYGFTPGTERFAECVFQLDQNHRANIFRSSSIIK